MGVAAKPFHKQVGDNGEEASLERLGSPKNLYTTNNKGDNQKTTKRNVLMHTYTRTDTQLSIIIIYLFIYFLPKVVVVVVVVVVLQLR